MPYVLANRLQQHKQQWNNNNCQSTENCCSIKLIQAMYSVTSGLPSAVKFKTLTKGEGGRSN